MLRLVIIGLISATLKRKIGQYFLEDGNMGILEVLQYPNLVRKFVGGLWHGNRSLNSNS